MILLRGDIKTGPILLYDMQIFLMKSSDCVQGTMAERDPAESMDMATMRVIAPEIQAPRLCSCG